MSSKRIPYFKKEKEQEQKYSLTDRSNWVDNEIFGNP